MSFHDDRAVQLLTCKLAKHIWINNEQLLLTQTYFKNIKTYKKSDKMTSTFKHDAISVSWVQPQTFVGNFNIVPAVSRSWNPAEF